MTPPVPRPGSTPRPRVVLVAVVTALALAAPACGAADPDRSRGVPRSERIIVLAAASLTDAFGELGAAFEATHPDVSVTVSVAGSSSLVTAILEGAPADVFASASPTTMGQVVDAGETAGPPRTLARNVVEIAVPEGNPAGVGGVADLARPELVVGLCAPQLPCGGLARRALAQAGVTPSVDTEEPDVRALLAKLEAGELDAGVVYRSDVASAPGQVDGIEIPGAGDVVATYLIATLRRSLHPQVAGAFVDAALSTTGQATLRRWGFP
ncbi:MAG: molybdate ABC transporter substrate-binding protein [Acidimicrobiales bacterium]